MPTVELGPSTGRYLCFSEREEIALLRVQGLGVRAIAVEIGRSPSTVSRELRRNAATRGAKLEYRAGVAQWKAELAARRPRPAKLVVNDRLRDYVQDRLAGVVHAADGSVLGPPTATWKGRNRPLVSGGREPPLYRSLRTVRDSLPSYGSHSPAFFCLGRSVGSSPEGLTSKRP